MPIYIRNRETEALARRLSGMKSVGLTEVIHEALQSQLERETAKPSLVERSEDFVRRLHARADKARGLPADKDFIDSLYE